MKWGWPCQDQQEPRWIPFPRDSSGGLVHFPLHRLSDDHGLDWMIGCELIRFCRFTTGMLISFGTKARVDVGTYRQSLAGFRDIENQVLEGGCGKDIHSKNF